jgi:hypothetical protein
MGCRGLSETRNEPIIDYPPSCTMDTIFNVQANCSARMLDLAGSKILATHAVFY